MPHTPSVSNSTKRKSPATAPTPRKRTKRSNDVSERPRSEPRTRKQKTLTQIDFVERPPTKFGDDDDLQEIESRPNRKSLAGIKKVPGLKKRNSTLTQMQFFDVEKFEDDDFDNKLLIGDPETNVHNGLAQLDGTSVSVERSLSRKHNISGSTGRARQHGWSETDTLSYPEHEVDVSGHNSNSKPTRTQKKAGTRRRRRGRVPPLEPLPIAAEASESSNQPVKIPCLEIQDSTEFNEIELLEKQDSLKLTTIPKTPQKRRDTIPSSQSPESPLSSTKRKEIMSTIISNPSEPRTPLRERSTNLPSILAKLSPKKGLSISPRKPSPSRKICVLKVPDKVPTSRKLQFEDTEQDVWSLPSTSSIQREGAGPVPGSKRLSETRLQNLQPGSSMEIPSTSQVNNGSEHVTLASSVSHIDPGTVNVPVLDRLELITNSYGICTSDQDSTMLVNGVATTDFGYRKDAYKVGSYQIDGALPDQAPFDNNVVNMIPDLTQPSEDDESDFGSPIANDTQFIANLKQRTSSPLSSPKAMAVTLLTNPPPEDENLTIPRIVSPAVEHRGSSQSTVTPIPTPKLVRTSPQGPVSSHHTDSNAFLPSLRHTRSGAHLSSTRMPLKEVQGTRSSSPLLPRPETATQKSIYPASMPHPSQMSTQDPTQLFLPSSSAFQMTHIDPDDEIERISIKDTSSTSGRMSQIPSQHTQRLNIDLVEDSEAEEDDLDLDRDSLPPTTRNFRHKGVNNESETQTPTQYTERAPKDIQATIHSSSSPLIIHSTTRAIRDAQLEIVPLMSSQPDVSDQTHGSSPIRRESQSNKPNTGVTTNFERSNPTTTSETTPTTNTRQSDLAEDDLLSDVDMNLSQLSSPSPPPLKRKYSPIPGFDNDTQSNFTDDGYVTAAFIHRRREAGLYPHWFVPEPYQVQNAPRRSKKRKSGRAGGY